MAEEEGMEGRFASIVRRLREGGLQHGGASATSGAAGAGGARRLASDDTMMASHVRTEVTAVAAAVAAEQAGKK